MPAMKRSKAKSSKALPTILILAGIFILIAVVFSSKSRPAQQMVTNANSLETQFDQYLKEGKPIFAFFHSTDCQSCVDMMAIVDQVYPEFEDTIALVDVNVYAPANQNLLRRVKVYSIPTQVFIDHNGQGKVAIGVMSPDDLRNQLLVLAESEK